MIRPLDLDYSVFGAGPHWYHLMGKSDALIREGDYKQALVEANRALKEAMVRNVLNRPSVVAETLGLLADIYKAQGDNAQSKQILVHALSILEGHPDSSFPDVASKLDDWGRKFSKSAVVPRRNYDLAELLYMRSWGIREKALGPEHLDVAISLYNLADLYETLREYSKAETLYRHCLAIREKQPELSSLFLVDNLEKLGEIYLRKEDYANAIPFFVRSLGVIEKYCYPDRLAVASTLNKLADIYFKQGDYLAVASTLNKSADIYFKQGDYAKAEPLYKRSLAIREQALGPDHPNVATSLENLAALYLATNRTNEAQKLEELAARIRAIKR